MHLNDLPDRIRARITVDLRTGCWLWDTVRRDGYTQVSWQGRKWLTHRLTYSLLVSEIPAGKQLDHRCRVTHCVNPAHLEPVTALVNTQRSLGNNSKTHCPAGHEYTPENTIESKVRRHRECRACVYARNAKWRAARPGYQPPSRRKS